VARAIVLLCWLAAVAVAAPARVVRGVVTPVGSSRPIVGATAYSEHGAIATTDNDGYFKLEVPASDRDITVAAPGYESRTIRVDDELMRIELQPASGSEVIELEGKAPEETKPISYELTSDEIRVLPGAGNDVLRAAQILPGVARIPYSFGGLVLRGMSPRDTTVYLDGVEVPIAFHFGGVTSFYPSEMLKDLSLVAGGFSSEYGRAQGGLVTLTTREPRTDRWRTGGSIGLLDSSVMAEGPVAGGGLIVGVRRSYFDTVTGPFVAADIPLPSYWDVQVRGSFGDPRTTGRITPMIFTSIDRIATNDPSGNRGKYIAITSLFVRAAMPYLRVWGPLTLHVVPWIGTNRLTFEDNDNVDRTPESFSRPVYPGGVRADLTRDYPWGDVRGGVDLEGGYLSHTQIGFSGAGDGPTQSNGQSSLAWGDLGAWVETRIKLDGERFAVKPGLRFDGFGLTHERTFDPRLNISQRLTPTVTLRQSIGRFHQPPTPSDVDPADGNPRLKSSYVDQLSLGVDSDLSRWTTASVTGFYNYGKNISVLEPTLRPGDSYEPNFGGLGPTFQLLLEKQLGFPQYRRNVGRARSAGVEVLVKRSTPRWFGMIAYTLSIAERVDDPAKTFRGPEAYLWRPFELDQTHNLNVAGSVQLEHWRLGARIQIVSGNPYSPTTGMGDVHPWAGNLPTFFQLDLRGDRRWHRCWGDINFYIDIQNATNNSNVEGRNFDDFEYREKDIPGLPIVPFLGVEFLPK
jgi:hypothetical protein